MLTLLLTIVKPVSRHEHCKHPILWYMFCTLSVEHSAGSVSAVSTPQLLVLKRLLQSHKCGSCCACTPRCHEWPCIIMEALYCMFGHQMAPLCRCTASYHQQNQRYLHWRGPVFAAVYHCVSQQRQCESHGMPPTGECHLQLVT